MISGEGGNVAVQATDEGVVLVDDMFYRNHSHILTHVKSLTDALRYVINTHQRRPRWRRHEDAADRGSDRAQNVRANLAHIRRPCTRTARRRSGCRGSRFPMRPPCFSGGKARAKYFGRGHTNGDAIVYFPELKTIHTGDLFLGRQSGARGSGSASTPARTRPPGVNIYVDYAQGGSFLDWTKTLDGVLALDFDTVIPGHGPVSTKTTSRSFGPPSRR
jgi:glyoxylase-like metal-dependent hydrolase (beta-lactamase superfamily II)